LLKAKGERSALLIKTPFSPAEIIDKDLDIEALENGVKRLEALKEDLF
jgi:hypothetical protein